MRLFALYLPQFHETQENNEWWGKGFTEWTHVRAAKPIYKGHLQPIAPANDNYYDLMNKETVQWQTQLMHEHGIDGFVYYHYYFQGKKLLEKPAENLLKWKDIDQPFFFCWANHSWYQAKNGVKKLLLEQTYGIEADWEAHFQYLLPFFQDARYEKRDNCPVFMVFKPDFPEMLPMMDYFDRRCRESGFDGIYVIETFLDATRPENFAAAKAKMTPQTRQIYIREPAVSYFIWTYQRRFSPVRLYRKVCRDLAKKGLLPYVDRCSGDALYRIMCSDAYPQGENLCHGVSFSWDNTPRHGVRGYVLTPPSKENFLRFARTIENDEYVFINAWNEWAEGMTLEPTAHEGTTYLSWIKEWTDQMGKA